MRRRRAMNREEQSDALRKLAARAAAGELHLPDGFAAMRLALGPTQQEFARRLGMTRSQVGDLESGRANPTLETIGRVGRLFGLAVGLIPRRWRGETALPEPKSAIQTDIKGIKTTEP